MIKSIEIQNFQSHANTRCEFHPGVNVIVGSSDAGKTAIIRALRWVIWNRPSGPTIQSHWGGETKVIIETEDAVTITRTKGKSDSYISHVTGEEDMEYKAFGLTVPQEIVQLLNINEINLQRQLDAPFLLSETSGNVAKHFNKIAKFDEIDTSLSKIKTELTGITYHLNFDRQSLKDKKEELEKFAHLETTEIKLEVLEGMVQEHTALSTAQKKILNLIYRWEVIDEDLKNYQPILALENKVSQITSWQDKRDTLFGEYLRLEQLIRQIERLTIKVKKQKQKTALESHVDNLLLLHKNKASEESRIFQLNAAITLLSNTQTQLTQEVENEGRLQAKYKRLFPNVCPFCGSKVKLI